MIRIATVSGSRKALCLDINVLLATRFLIQANSGGGKSYAIRKILEETHGKVQQIILDLEGEFSSLREKYDYVLIGKGQNVDVQIDLKSAELLAKKSLELNVSTIIDLSELKKHERTLFVKRFLEGLIEAPKKLWHPALVIVDEAHQFCPEGKSGKAESTGAVIDLMTRGRKRGLCGVLATQRISKLSKDAAAECNNKAIGRTGLDVDMKRAGEELGFTSKEDVRSLRRLNAGEFYFFGPALTKEIIKANVDKVKTTHPDLNRKIGFTHSPPTAKIKSLLAKLADLPQKAEAELLEKRDFVRRIRSLEAQLRVKERSKSGNSLDPTELRELKIKNKLLEKEKAKLINHLETFEKKYRPAYQKAQEILEQIKKVVNNQSWKRKDIRFPNHNLKLRTAEKFSKTVLSAAINKLTPSKHEMPTPRILEENNEGVAGIGRCPKKIYNFLYSNQDQGFTKVQIGAMIGYSPKSGGFNNALGYLNIRGLIRKEGELIFIGAVENSIIDDGEVFSIDLIKNKLSKCPNEIFEVLLENPGEEFTKEDLAENTPTQYSPNSGGFNNAICKLNSLGFLERTNGRIKLSKYLEELQDGFS